MGVIVVGLERGLYIERGKDREKRGLRENKGEKEASCRWLVGGEEKGVKKNKIKGGDEEEEGTRSGSSNLGHIELQARLVG